MHATGRSCPYRSNLQNRPIFAEIILEFLHGGNVGVTAGYMFRWCWHVLARAIFTCRERASFGLGV